MRKRRNHKSFLRRLLRGAAKLLPTRWRLAMGIRLRKKPVRGLNPIDLEKGMEEKNDGV